MRRGAAHGIRRIGRIGPIAALAAALASAMPCAAEQPETRLAPGWREVRWIAVGGGADPESNQVSLEQDLALVQQVFARSGRLLFAGGPGTLGVQVFKRRAAKRSLVRILGGLFDPRQGRNTTYRPALLKADGPATLERVEQEIGRAVRRNGTTLFLYFATHGEIGDKARDNRILLWGGADLTVARLAELLDASPSARRVAFVSTACYSGGFADIAFAAADPGRGASTGDRCGLFASEWNEVSSGCDANPDRRKQESYALHFLHALRGEDRDGRPLAARAIDFDRDGKITLLEAHARARQVSRSFDVPTTTSERWLRHAAPAEGPETAVPLPEDVAVISALGGRLKLGNEAAVRLRLDGTEKRAAEIDARMAEAETHEAQCYARLRIALLERWPVLDDPWHPDFPSTVNQAREQIEELLESSAAGVAYREARADVDQQAVRFDRARTTAALHRRLLRAYENRTLAARLRAKGGAEWEHYQRLLACERSSPRE